MSEPIKVGDKVMLVYGACADIVQYIGTVFEVRRVRFDRARCVVCWHTTAPGTHVEIELNGGWGPIPISWVRKMPPDSDRIEEREPSEVTA